MRRTEIGGRRSRLVTSIVAALFLLTGAGCLASGEAPVSIAGIQKMEQRIRADALREFGYGFFHKDPMDETGQSIDPLAPLLIHALPNGLPLPLTGLECGFGAVFRGADGTLVVNKEQPTVYTTRRQTRIGERMYEQVVYVWWYTDVNSPAPALRPVPTGFCVTLGQDGFPATWEVLGAAADRRVLFVSASLEQSARRAFGAPLRYRRLSVERGITEAPDVFIARILEDGPVPMGPYVYLDWTISSVVGILCRCMPSQVANLPVSSSYDLQPLESLADWGIELTELGWRFGDFRDVRDRDRGDEAHSLSPPLRWPPDE